MSDEVRLVHAGKYKGACWTTFTARYPPGTREEAISRARDKAGRWLVQRLIEREDPTQVEVAFTDLPKVGDYEAVGYGVVLGKDDG